MTDPNAPQPLPEQPVAATPSPDPTITPAATVPVTRQKWFLPTVTGVAGLLVGLALGVGVLGIAGAVSDGLEEAKADKAAAAAAKEVAAEAKKRAAMFENALSACGLTIITPGVSADEGRSLSLDMVGNEDFDGISYTDSVCVWQALQVPEAIQTKMGETRALDGRQTDEFDGIEVSWSYHPDEGLDTLFEMQD